MATKYASFHDNYRPASGYNYQDYYIDIGYTETYNQAEKRSEVKLEVVQEKTTFSPGNCRFSGIVKFQTTGGTTVVTKTLSDSSCDITLMADSWSDVSSSSGGTGYIPYNTDGTASFVVRLEANQYSHFGAVFSGRALGIQDINLPATLTVALPTHTSSLTVNPNGGTWGGSTSSQTFSQLPKTTKTVANPTRTGYTFSGWTRSGSTTGSISSTTYTFGDDGTTTTLTASWTPITYTVSYKKGSYGTGTDTSATKTYDVALTLKGATFTRTGYTQDGWSTNSGGSTKDYNLSASYTANAAITLYPHWSANTYTVKFNANSGSGTMSNESFTYDVSKALTTNAFTRTGYTFKGWDTNSAGSTVVYTNGQSVKNLATSGTVNLYAVWQINTWTVGYSANGHGTAPASQTKTYGVSLTLQQFISNQTGSGTTSNYTVTGNANGGTWSGSNGSATKKPNYTYSQTYWNTNSGGTGTNYASKGSYTANSAATLYAIWKTTTSYSYTYTLPTGTPTKNQTATVTFNANGGSTSKASESATRAMKFNGWYTAATGGTKRTTSSQISANETVYAQYGNGTSAYPNVSLPTAAQCTRTGYNLLGWATSSSATTAAYAPGASYTPTATTTLYAVWQKITYSLSLTKSATGVVVNVTRTESPIGGGSIGLLDNGATLYYNDKLTVAYSVNTGYTLQTAAINGVTMGGTSQSVTVTANQAVVITVELGAVMYIGDGANWNQYQIFIGDGASWHQYQAYIGNGASWDAY